MGVCLPSFGITAGASLFATKSSACFRIVGNPFSVIYSLSFFDRWKRLRKSDFASLSKRLVRSYSFLSEEMFSFNSSSGNNDGYMYFCDTIICCFLFPMLYPYTTACPLYSRHKVALRFCLSEYGICRISHSYADISIRSERNPNALLVWMIQDSVRS